MTNRGRVDPQFCVQVQIAALVAFYSRKVIRAGRIESASFWGCSFIVLFSALLKRSVSVHLCQRKFCIPTVQKRLYR